MSEIPAATKEKAVGLTEEIASRLGATTAELQWLEHIITEALMQERAMCAKIAEGFPDIVMHMVDRPGGPPGNFVRASNGKDIAAEIRSPTADTTQERTP